MKRVFAALAFWLCGTPAFAGITCSLPFTLTNGTTADASQVMANYNALVSCLALAAGAGNNTDITALLGLTTALQPSEGGSATFVANSVSFASNTYTIPATTPTGFSLVPGNRVIFVAPATTGGATQIKVGSTAATNLFKSTASGPAPLSGAEIQINNIVVATFDGTEFQTIVPVSVSNPTAHVTQQTFTANGTYTPTAGMQFVIVTACGGGGGGGGTAASATGTSSGGGGGAGAYAQGVFPAATIGASQSVTIGAAGAASAAGNHGGGNGGNTSLGSILILNGGLGGAGSPANTSGSGGAGGAVSVVPGGAIFSNGNTGMTGLAASITTVSLVSGKGASSPFSEGGAAVSTSANAINGASGQACSGGSGALSNATASNASGGAGGAGIMTMLEIGVF